jgi:peptidoglycan hydrolase-like protein with peptidoglycan-binding domain
MSLLAVGPRPVLKLGSTGSPVRRVQRLLNAATHGTNLTVSGIFDSKTDIALKTWQNAQDRRALGVVNRSTWKALASGLRG